MCLAGRDAPRGCELTAVGTAAAYWHGLLRPDVELQPAFWDELSGAMRERRLTFGDRVHCPFLRPLFLSPGEVARVAGVAETIARLGERVARVALEDESLLDAVALSDAERGLVALDPGYGTASTASRLDGFLLPDSLGFAEYNAESPAGLGYTERLAELFDGLELMARFRQRFTAEHFRPARAMLDALLASYREWGGTANPPVILITDWRDVPTWSEFEILQARFQAAGVPAIVCPPQELEFTRGRLVAGGQAVDLVYRRVLMNDILARAGECGALIDAVRANAVCMANTFRCKVAHKKAFFAVLTAERYGHLFSAAERAVVTTHVPWTRLIADVRTERRGASVDLLNHLRGRREELVIKPNDEYGGAGVVLGWEADERAWDAAIERAIAGRHGWWVAQERIPVRREIFPMVETPHRVVLRDMLVDLAPYMFRGRVAGFLTRLSSTGLANVTSGGGQVPACVVAQREA